VSLSDELRLFFAFFALLIGYCGIIWVINIPAYRYRSRFCADSNALADWLLSPFYLLSRILHFVLLIMVSPLVILIAIPLLPLLALFGKLSNWINRLLEALSNPEKYVIFFRRMIQLGLWIQFIPDDQFAQFMEYLEKRSKAPKR